MESGADVEFSRGGGAYFQKVLENRAFSPSTPRSHITKTLFDKTSCAADKFLKKKRG